MIKNSIAIVLKRFPYSDTSLIARCFVKDLGKVSFIVHGAHRKKSPMGAYFQPANCLNLVYYFKNNYPGIKPLRKRDNNLIQPILREEGIYSKFAVKLFNTYKDISVMSYSLMKEALGIQLIQKLNPELLREKYHLGRQLNLD